MKRPPIKDLSFWPRRIGETAEHSRKRHTKGIRGSYPVSKAERFARTIKGPFA